MSTKQDLLNMFSDEDGDRDESIVVNRRKRPGLGTEEDERSATPAGVANNNLQLKKRKTVAFSNEEGGYEDDDLSGNFPAAKQNKDRLKNFRDQISSNKRRLKKRVEESESDADEEVPGKPTSKQKARHKSSDRERRREKGKNKKGSSSSGSSNKKESKESENNGYAWEDKIQRPWDIVDAAVGDDDETIIAAKIMELRRKRASIDIKPFQRGIIRSLIIAIDFSEVMGEKDLRPSRLHMSVQYCIEFVYDFFDQNPISQLGVISMKNGVAQVVSPMSGNPQDHIEILQNLKRKLEPKGFPSLQNGLELSRGLLMNAPAHSTREILIIYGSLSSTDPGDIHQTIQSLVEEKIRVNIIGLTAQVSICKELCKQTNYGDESFYNVILNEQHFKDLVMEAVTPLPMNKLNKSFTLVKMGFPTRAVEDTPSFCACHSKLVHGGYYCPNCNNKVCSLPIVCPCCQLMLILSTHIARSYHHLIPLKTFKEVPIQNDFPTNHCFGCQRRFPKLENKKTGELLTSMRYRCDDCKHDFCIECDAFVHEMLHNCPGCESKTNI